MSCRKKRFVIDQINVENILHEQRKIKRLNFRGLGSRRLEEFNISHSDDKL